MKKKILYVDDEKINLMLLKVNLRDNYEVLTTDCPSKGLELLKTEKDISIVISDMKMPNMSGIEFIKHAKLEYSNIKFFILTGLEITTEIEESIDSGLILNYFKKPFDPQQIIKSLDAAIL